jgi:hypothetical protein
MCGTKLPGTAKADENALKEQQKLIGEPAPKSAAEVRGDQRLSKTSMFLGIFGLGIPAIITGWLAIKRGQAGREKAMIGIGLGSLSTVVLLVLLITLAAPSSQHPVEPPPSRDDLLDSELASFELSVERQLVEFRDLTGELASYFEEDELPEEVVTCYDMIEDLERQLDTLKSLDDEREVRALRHRMRAGMRDLKRILRDYTYN